jgi:hypothetical protein
MPDIIFNTVVSLWDGRYLLFWSRSGEMVIMNFDGVYPRDGL